MTCVRVVWSSPAPSVRAAWTGPIRVSRKIAGLAVDDRQALVPGVGRPALVGWHRDPAEDPGPRDPRRRGERHRRRLDDHRGEVGMGGGRSECDADGTRVHQALDRGVVGCRRWRGPRVHAAEAVAAAHPGHRSVAAERAA